MVCTLGRYVKVKICRFWKGRERVNLKEIICNVILSDSKFEF